MSQASSKTTSSMSMPYSYLSILALGNAKTPSRQVHSKYLYWSISDQEGFFGALRIQQVQDAWDPTLALRRPATTGTAHVYDTVKTRIDEALQNACEYVILSCSETRWQTACGESKEKAYKTILVVCQGQRDQHNTSYSSLLAPEKLWGWPIACCRICTS